MPARLNTTAPTAKATPPSIQAAPSRQPAPVAAAKPATSKGVAAPTSVKGEVSHETIARRAFEISQSGNGGSPEDNWYRAERELRGSV